MIGILAKRKTSAGGYPAQFWLLFGSLFINRATTSMMWPFLTVYMYQKLGVPLTTVALILSVRAVTSLISTTVVSPIMDRAGRKTAMVISLMASSAVFMGMAAANGIWMWVILIAAHGLVLPIFNVGVNAMVADLVSEERRAPAYALIRMVSNAGIAIGPVIGGVLALISFELIFLITAVVYVLLAMLVISFIRETNPMQDKIKNDEDPPARGYSFLLADKLFLAFCAAFILIEMGYSQMFSLLPVYVTENFGLRENQYSLLITVNAAMVVFFQYAVTRYSVRYRPFLVIAIGSALYGLGLLSIAWGSTMLHFALSVGIVTLGELLLLPTATTMIANHAPVDMRARYLGIFSIAYPLASGIGPVMGGLLNDHIAPQAIWYGAALVAVAGTFAFWRLGQRWPIVSAKRDE